MDDEYIHTGYKVLVTGCAPAATAIRYSPKYNSPAPIAICSYSSIFLSSFFALLLNAAVSYGSRSSVSSFSSGMISG